MSDDPDDRYYHDYIDDLPADEDEDFFDCGMMPDGQCSQAGTEWCDWDCPRNK
jgi:hypothetical protein